MKKNKVQRKEGWYSQNDNNPHINIAARNKILQQEKQAGIYGSKYPLAVMLKLVWDAPTRAS